MITQAYVWMLAELYLKPKDDPDASSDDNNDCCCGIATGLEVINHKADEKADGPKCKHETDRACYKDDCNSH